MGALGLLSITAGIIMIRSAFTGETPIQVIAGFLDMADLPHTFTGFGGGGGFSGSQGGGSSWDTEKPPAVVPPNVQGRTFQ
jgi:hypothetical protein